MHSQGITDIHIRVFSSMALITSLRLRYQATFNAGCVFVDGVRVWVSNRRVIDRLHKDLNRIRIC